MIPLTKILVVLGAVFASLVVLGLAYVAYHIMMFRLGASFWAWALSDKEKKAMEIEDAEWERRLPVYKRITIVLGIIGSVTAGLATFWVLSGRRPDFDRVALGILIVAIVAGLLFTLKIKNLVLYAVIEIGFAIWVSVQTLWGFSDAIAFKELASLCASVYLLIRGLDNLKKDADERQKREAKPRIEWQGKEVVVSRGLEREEFDRSFVRTDDSDLLFGGRPAVVTREVVYPSGKTETIAIDSNLLRAKTLIAIANHQILPYEEREKAREEIRRSFTQYENQLIT